VQALSVGLWKEKGEKVGQLAVYSSQFNYANILTINPKKSSFDRQAAKKNLTSLSIKA
jgi:hypothetical protein